MKKMDAENQYDAQVQMQGCLSEIQHHVDQNYS